MTVRPCQIWLHDGRKLLGPDLRDILCTLMLLQSLAMHREYHDRDITCLDVKTRSNATRIGRFFKLELQVQFISGCRITVYCQVNVQVKST